MKYPYFAYSDNITIQPLFKNLSGDPFIVDMSVTSHIFNKVDVLDQKNFQQYLDSQMQDKFTWGLSSYLENREIVLSEYPQMVEEKRFFHLGLDIIVPLGTPLYAPLDSKVKDIGYEAGNGNYGNYVMLMHESEYFDTFYSFYGHLSSDTLPIEGQNLKAGDQFALIGDFHENGNWFFHTHLQIITQNGLDKGYISKGYCSENDLSQIEQLCPSPLPLFRK
jgi:murein DD-endopeptidase MepM/ murein hydrolase activator NlpD